MCNKIETVLCCGEVNRTSRLLKPQRCLLPLPPKMWHSEWSHSLQSRPVLQLCFKSWLSCFQSRSLTICLGYAHCVSSCHHSWEPDGALDPGLLPGPALIAGAIWEMHQWVSHLPYLFLSCCPFPSDFQGNKQNLKYILYNTYVYMYLWFCLCSCC